MKEGIPDGNSGPNPNSELEVGRPDIVCEACYEDEQRGLLNI